MSALLDNVPVLHDKDDVRLADGGQAVGDDEARSALHHSGKRRLNVHLRARVDGACGLVENEHRRQAEHDTRDAKKLLLSF